jgi:hypothetical protein
MPSLHGAKLIGSSRHGAQRIRRKVRQISRIVTKALQHVAEKQFWIAALKIAAGQDAVNASVRVLP